MLSSPLFPHPATAFGRSNLYLRVTSLFSAPKQVTHICWQRHNTPQAQNWFQVNQKHVLRVMIIELYECVYECVRLRRSGWPSLIVVLSGNLVADKDTKNWKEKNYYCQQFIFSAEPAINVFFKKNAYTTISANRALIILVSIALYTTSKLHSFPSFPSELMLLLALTPLLCYWVLTFLNLHQGCSWKRERLLCPPRALQRDDREEAQDQALSTDRCGDLTTRQYSSVLSSCTCVCFVNNQKIHNRLLGRVTGYAILLPTDWQVQNNCCPAPQKHC